MYRSWIDETPTERLEVGVCKLKSGTQAVRVVNTADVPRSAGLSDWRWNVTALFVVRERGRVADVAGRGKPRSMDLPVLIDG